MDNYVQYPLISICVVAYNSSRTILETLESAKTQTYPNIELIVSDDCSTDNTELIVKEWLEKNKNYFSSVLFVKTESNSGVSINANLATSSSHGEWIKGIAADDRLKPEAISEYFNFVTKNHCDICICDLDIFADEGDVPKSIIESYRFCFECAKESREQKLYRLAKEYALPGPGLFSSRKLFEELGGNDERYPMCEEIPSMYRILRAGYQVYPLEKKLVEYRYSGNSLSQHKGRKLGNRRWFFDRKKIFYDMQLPELLKTHRYMIAWVKILSFAELTQLYKGSFISYVYYYLLKVIDPATYYVFIKQIFQH